MAAYIHVDPQAGGKNYGMLSKYMSLEQFGKVQVEYIWIGGTGLDIRAKTRTLKAPTDAAGKTRMLTVKDLPCWNYDGSSTGQAKGHYSEIWLKPVRVCRDPFRGGDNILCLCECLNAKTMEPIETNKRNAANKVFEQKEVEAEETWFGIEQEYTLFDSTGTTPLGWPNNGYPAPQGPYYCSVGSNVAHGRHVAQAHYRASLYAGLEISGINAEVMAGQWEYQVGPCTGIDSGDQMWLSRYIMDRIAEDFGVLVSYEAKPVKGDWNGAGAHCNYSTKSTRAKGGYKAILDAIEKLGKAHDIHMEVYGRGNRERMTGAHETADYNTFKFGVADRGASIRIPRQCELDQCGYLEDRRPAANCDPYDVTSMIARTTVLNDPMNLNEIAKEMDVKKKQQDE